MSDDDVVRSVVLAYLRAEQRLFAGATDFDEVRELLAPDVVMHQSGALPYGGEWKGAAAIEAMFRRMGKLWESLEISDVEFFFADSGAVVLFQMRVVGVTTGMAYAGPMAQVIRVSDGRIREFWPFYWNTAEVVEALLPAGR